MRSLFTLTDLDSLDLPIWLVNLFLVFGLVKYVYFGRFGLIGLVRKV